MSKSFSNTFENAFKSILPSPLVIAILLTLLAFALSIGFAHDQTFSSTLLNWYNGMWSTASLAFLVQMMLMLILGHIVALSAPVAKLISKLTAVCTSSEKAVWLVTFSSIAVGLMNWGLGLIFGAILVRSIRTEFAKKQIPINSGLLGACGYAGMLFWHGGLSGSAPLKVAEPGHIKGLLDNSLLPEVIGFGDTVFSVSNCLLTLLALIVTPLIMRWIAKKSNKTAELNTWDNSKLPTENVQNETLLPAEKLDHKQLATWLGLFILAASVIIALGNVSSQPLGFINPNFINFTLLGLAFFTHKSFNNFSNAANEAITDGVGILIQFPLYFGIMGIINQSGLAQQMAEGFSAISTPTSFSFLTILSSGLLNLFVPSGGGQWVIQGPILLQAALDLGVPLNKVVLAFSYGDQLTNMLQPFWALPLLGITQLKAKDILPYTLVLFVIGFCLFSLAVFLF